MKCAVEPYCVGALVALVLSVGCGGVTSVTSDKTTLANLDKQPAENADLWQETRDYLARGDTSAALTSAEFLVDRAQSSPQNYYVLGVALARSGRWNDAKRMALLAYEDSPEAPYIAAQVLAAKADIALGTPGDCVRRLENLISDDESNLSYRNIHGKCLLAAGDADSVMADARAVLKQNETDIGAMKNLAGGYLATKQHEHAIYVLTQAVELSPEDAESWFLLAEAKYHGGLPTEMLRYIERAVELDPNFPEARIVLGAVYREFGDSSGARAQLEAAAKLVPMSSDAHLNLGNAYRGLGEVELAEASYRRALDLQPDLVVAHYNLGLLFLENDVPGMELVQRLERAIGELRTYRESGGATPKENDEIARYETEARERIKIELSKRNNLPKTPDSDEQREEDDGGGDGEQPPEGSAE